MDKPGVMSQQVLCCNARSWTRALAWIQIVLSSIGLLVFSIFFIAFIVALGSVEDGSQDAAELEKLGGARVIVAAAVVHIIIIGICLLNLAGGILLVQGVNQENPTKFYCWLIIQGIRIGFTVLKSILVIEMVWSGPGFMVWSGPTSPDQTMWSGPAFGPDQTRPDHFGPGNFKKKNS